MRIFKSRWFARFARKNGLSDAALTAAVEAIEAGNFDADLGGYVFKQRVARAGQGKRGGYRTIVLLKRGERAFFVYGFAKSEMDNIADDDEKYYKSFAKRCVDYPDAEIETAINAGEFIEIAEAEK
jgi:hypothetical protein